MCKAKKADIRKYGKTVVITSRSDSKFYFLNFKSPDLLGCTGYRHESVQTLQRMKLEMAKLTTKYCIMCIEGIPAYRNATDPTGSE